MLNVRSVITRLDEWRPIRVDEIQKELGGFHSWCLCGGLATDWCAGRQTREHGDTDIGVFRKDLADCLREFSRGRVFLCDPPGSLTPWTGNPISEAVHDIWIADHEIAHWVMQIMVYDDEGSVVVYRRDRRIRWDKAAHSIDVRGMKVINPAITLLFKANKESFAPKDLIDIETLVSLTGNAFTSGGT